MRSQIHINSTFNVSRLIGLEAAKRKVKAYVRPQPPFYTSPEKGSHDEKEDIKPVGSIGTWWHETLRALAAIEERVDHHFIRGRNCTHSRDLQPQPRYPASRVYIWTLHTQRNAYVLALCIDLFWRLIYYPAVPTVLTVAAVYGYMKKPMKTLCVWHYCTLSILDIERHSYTGGAQGKIL
jgi:hypothetical protein